MIVFTSDAVCPVFVYFFTCVFASFCSLDFSRLYCILRSLTVRFVYYYSSIPTDYISYILTIIIINLRTMGQAVVDRYHIQNIYDR